MKKILILVIAISLLSTTVACAEGPGGVIAESAILMDYENNRVLWGKGPDEKLAVASTTKILTAVVAIENQDLESDVTISENVVNMDYSSMDLEVGEKIKLKYLLYALLLESCNDAAVAIAEHVSGSESQFAALMNEKAKGLGAVNSNFVTASGLDILVDHYSTARDMALITSYAMKNPTFREVFSTKEYAFSSSVKAYYFENQNIMLEQYVECVGGKTGYTYKARHSYVGVFDAYGKKFVCVVLRSSEDGKWSDASKIIEYAFKNYEIREIYAPEFVSGGNVIKFEEPFYLLLNEGEYKNILISYDESSQVIKFSVGGHTIYEEKAPVPQEVLKQAVVEKAEVRYIPVTAAIKK
ncbi:MAG: serine hydrolase [Clostridiales bacterium]|jgi:D-alanyl-D-alanine carboxypeptidase (penicillin-binding protein 5/6)|nr:serine hydrolase [Clostridiales bacterium]